MVRQAAVIALTFLASFGTLSLVRAGVCDVALAGEVFCDDFLEERPVEWTIIGNPSNSISISNGRATLSGTNFPNAVPQIGQLGDVSIQAVGRLTEGALLGIEGRYDRTSQPERNYWILAGDDGILRDVSLGRGGTNVQDLHEMDVSFSPLDQLIAFQLDMFGDQVSYRIWPADEPMPGEPLAIFTDTFVSSGDVTIVTASAEPFSGPATAVFEYFRVATQPITQYQPIVPEPGAGFLLLCGGLTLLYWRSSGRVRAGGPSPRLLGVVLVACAATEPTSIAHAQFFRDDFDAIQRPVTWEVAFDASEELIPEGIIDGNFVVTPPEVITNPPFYESDFWTSDRAFDNVSIRARAKILGDGGYWFGIFARGTDTGSAFLGMSGDGEISASVVDQNVDEEHNIVSISLSAEDHDVELQLDVTADRIDVWAWEAETPRPLTPNSSIGIPDYIADSGRVGFWLASETPSSPQLALRYFEVAPVPEPAGMSLGLLGGMGFFALARRRSFLSGKVGRTVRGRRTGLPTSGILCIVLSAGATLAVSSTTQAQFFRDGFDGQGPVTWTPMEPLVGGERNVADDGFVVVPPSEPTGIPGLPEDWAEADTMVDGRTFGNVSIRTQVSALESGDSWIGVLARSRFNALGDSDSAVLAGISNEGGLLLRTFDESGVGQAMDETTSTDLRPDQHDVLFRLDVSDDSAWFWAWHADDPRPLFPSLTISDLPDYIVDEGPIGIWSASILPAQTPVAYRFFEAAPVPEPSGLSLGLLGYTCLFALGRRKTVMT